MRSTQQMSITLPLEMAALVKAKVAAGEYASESEVIRDGLRALLARDRAMEDWLRDEVIPAATALEAKPELGLSPEQVREQMAARRQRKGTREA
ncbi:CopG family transcriptional regulator [Pseudomonas sp. GL93]|uniref:ribbon-helix-helix domain-containing protein n=1 Tax=Pseudomonas sp. GL93 TaxID=2014741 RepID=UPI000E3163EC|nr:MULTISPECIES: type II toxin-antitoxin system ParD family antitoxin [unclassified Pseudomonas]RFD28581.1 CopG family transcriptional regulator [Pseudomonas sp. GL93]